MYLTRLNIFASNNPYYGQGGEFNVYDKMSQMPNCTLYAYLRMEEALELTERNDKLIRPGGGFPNAKNWYSSTSLPKGQELRDGSVAVFDGNYGHVAFVERVFDSTHAFITHSQYDDDKSLRNYKYWERRSVSLIPGKATLAGVGRLIGFIYPPVSDKRVVRNEKEQIEILDDFVNVRNAAGGEIKNTGCFAPAGIYNVLNSKEVDGYVWYKLDSKCWVREGDWLTHYPAANEEVAQLKKEITSLKDRLKKVKEIVDYE